MYNENQLYTAGRFAQKAGVSLRTVRYYDEKGLLKPTSYNEAGYRLYDGEKFERLQRILTLKYLGFSLDEIKDLVDQEMKVDRAIHIQKEAVKQKISQMESILKALNSAEDMFNGELVETDEIQWEKFTDVIKAINLEEQILNQFINSSRLECRIDFHERFGHDKRGFHKWIFDRIDFGDKNIKILDIGCGDGSIWLKNKDRIPKGCTIVLSDMSQGMIEKAKENLKGVDGEFQFRIANVNNLPFKDEEFDIVMVNYVLQFVEDRTKAFKEIKRALKKEGTFYTSTFSRKHMKELRETLREVNENVKLTLGDTTTRFVIENAEEQIKEVFCKVEMDKYEGSLRVDDTQSILNYMFSTSANINEVLNKKELKTLRNKFQSVIEEEGYFHITKETGLFKCRNQQEHEK
ncbi:MerR family transcriptional regulator [Oceanirhabdus seepicola]|uniref:Methyltransferase domain-containing protein n=1 Tax=Oceanirhabdus seepicola TaxID=2828781 RepID=A0A9J6P1R3_9CLOT|nr:methyltransferase domain-containing protein [Oceanirhabdus seepicola]MCM1989985.1 methyltransferase domain-containing protein [Oceanirhabdus seepicola]